MRYNPPGGSLGAAFAKLFGEEPDQQINEDLRHFKQIMETGEVATVQGQPTGRGRQQDSTFTKRNGRKKTDESSLLEWYCECGRGEVPDPQLINPRDAIIRVTSTAICGSDLHLYNGYVPTMKKGDILGHEFMGEVVEVGSKCGSSRRVTAWWCRFRSRAGVASFANADSGRCAIIPIRTLDLAEGLYGHSGPGLLATPT